MKTKGELETEISNAVNRFKREYMGRGPQEVRTYLVDDMALVRLKGVLTPAEQRLAQVEAGGGFDHLQVRGGSLEVGIEEGGVVAVARRVDADADVGDWRLGADVGGPLAD